MKKSLFIVISLVLLLAFTGCDKDIQIIGGADGPTSIIVSEKKDIYPVRMINVDDELYYDSGIFSDLSSRCGTLDGLLKTTVGEYKGELQTGTPWILQKEESGIWSSYPTKDGKDLVWTGLGLLINKNDKTIWKIDFETHYGKLTPGRYRVGKEITDFRGVGDYENKTYYAVFEIED